MTMNKTALRRTLALALCLTVSGAWACSLKDLRQQVAVLARFDTAPTQLPQEISLRASDLLSVLTPRSTTLQIVDARNKESDAMVVLEAGRYQMLSRHNGGKAPAEISTGVYPAHLEWRHFGAGAPGVAYLVLTADNNERALVRVHVAEPPAVSRGQDWVWSEARQGDVIELAPFDTLTFDLPGQPGDGWQVEMAGRPIALATIAVREPGPDASPVRALLRVKATDVLAGTRAEDTLTVRHAGGTVYRFTVLPLAVAACR